MIPGVTEVGKKEAEEVQQAVVYCSILSFLLKPPSLITKGFKENNKAQENILNNMCNFDSLAVFRNGIRATSYYLDVEIRKYKYHLLNLTPF